MIKEFKKSIGYICSSCSSIIIKDISLFDLGGNEKNVFRCTGGNTCSAVCFTISQKKDKYTISVDCPACGDQHLFNIRKATFWQSIFFVLDCPETGMGILFLGDREKIRNAIDTQEKNIMAMNDEYAICGELAMLFDAVEHINHLAKDQKVTCRCGSHDISIELDDTKITLLCRQCGCKLDIPTSENSLDKLLNTSTIVLD